MKNVILIFAVLYILSQESVKGQNGKDTLFSEGIKTDIYGFVRGGIYGGIDRADDKPYISSAFSDFGLKMKSEDGFRFIAFADLRFRYGTEFLEPVNRFDIREAFVTLTGRNWNLSVGQKVIKWGRADFTNPTSKLSPKNMVSRSPDPEDMDMGNLLADLKWYPLSILSFESVVVPYYRSSILLINPIRLPYYVKINQIESLITDKKMFSYGLKADIHIK